MKESSNESRSRAVLAASMAVFGTVGIFRRMIALSSGFVACFRGIVGALFLLLFIRCRRLPFRHGIGRKNVLLLLLSGAVMGLNWALLFEACSLTTVSTATLCYYMEPILVVLGSAVLFRERLSPGKALCAAAAFAGMILVSGILEGGLPASSDLNGILCGLGAALLYTIVVLMNKHMPGIDAYEKTTLQLASAGVVMIPYCLLTGGFPTQVPDTVSLIALLILGIVHTGICYVMYFGTMDSLPTRTIAIFSYIDPVTALILSAIFLKERLTLPGILGAVLILGAALLSELMPDKAK